MGNLGESILAGDQHKTDFQTLITPKYSYYHS